MRRVSEDLKKKLRFKKKIGDLSDSANFVETFQLSTPVKVNEQYSQLSRKTGDSPSPSENTLSMSDIL